MRSQAASDHLHHLQAADQSRRASGKTVFQVHVVAVYKAPTRGLLSCPSSRQSGLSLESADMSHGIRASFLALLLPLAFAITASAGSTVQVSDDLVRLPIAKHFNSTGGGKILSRDQARARQLYTRAKAQIIGDARPVPAHTVPVTNQAVIYTATVSGKIIGRVKTTRAEGPPSRYRLVLVAPRRNVYFFSPSLYGCEHIPDNLICRYSHRGYGEFQHLGRRKSIVQGDVHQQEDAR